MYHKMEYDWVLYHYVNNVIVLLIWETNFYQNMDHICFNFLFLVPRAMLGSMLFWINESHFLALFFFSYNLFLFCIFSYNIVFVSYNIAIICTKVYENVYLNENFAILLFIYNILWKITNEGHLKVWWIILK